MCILFQTGIVMTIDKDYTYKTHQLLPLPWQTTNYIGGYILKYPYFIGCMEAIIINGKPLEFEKIENSKKEGSIEVRWT